MLNNSQRKESGLTLKQENRKRDFIIRLGAILRIRKKFMVVSYGACLDFILEVFGMTYRQALEADPYELKRLYRQALKNDVLEDKNGYKYYIDENGRECIAIGQSQLEEKLKEIRNKKMKN